jgi:hypothetical protein
VESMRSRPWRPHRCCLPRLRRRRLPPLTSFGALSHGSHVRCLRFAAVLSGGPRKTRYRLGGLALGRSGLQPEVPLKSFCSLPVVSSW